MPIIISGDPTKSISLTGDQSKSIQASQVAPPPPAYIIDGLVQSHWLPSNAVLSGDNITSVVDSSGTENLVVNTVDGPGYGFYAKYEPSGWVSNGKTLSTMHLFGGRLIADGWGPRIGGTQPVTVACLVQKANNEWSAAANSLMWGWYSPYAQGRQMWSPTTVTTGGGQPIYGLSNTQYKLVRISGNYSSTYAQMASPLNVPQTDKMLVFVEYSGSAAVGSRYWRLWINNQLIALASESGGVGSIDGASQMGFALAAKSEGYGQGARSQISELRFAEFHIWRGVLSDSDRTNFMNDAMSRGGLV